jgi:murein DD-endopeptidase MepM/ murein hydrolase activator NlpD
MTTATLRSLRCVSDCPAAGVVRTGSRLRVRGRGLRRAYEVVFLGAEGEADDVSAVPLVRRRTSVDVDVPLAAVGGPVAVVERGGALTAPAPAPLVVQPGLPLQVMGTGGGAVVSVEARSRRAFYDSTRQAQATFLVHGTGPATVSIEVVRDADGAVIAHWDRAGVPPDVPQAVAWDGTAGGQVQREGSYSFRVVAQDAAGLMATSAQAQPEPAGPDPAKFVFLRHAFPILGTHGYGESGARFGGARGHQGHDVFAACGTPLVAARGGVVKFKQYHARAGHYIVIDGEQTGVDYSYMHLRDAALVNEGDRVRTGQLIGYVGDSGNASACHLHFEMWAAPGWYSGGAAFDPLPDLLSWDRRS